MLDHGHLDANGGDRDIKRPDRQSSQHQNE